MKVLVRNARSGKHFRVEVQDIEELVRIASNTRGSLRFPRLRNILGHRRYQIFLRKYIAYNSKKKEKTTGN